MYSVLHTYPISNMAIHTVYVVEILRIRLYNLPPLHSTILTILPLYISPYLPFSPLTFHYISNSPLCIPQSFCILGTFWCCCWRREFNCKSWTTSTTATRLAQNDSPWLVIYMENLKICSSYSIRFAPSTCKLGC